MMKMLESSRKSGWGAGGGTPTTGEGGKSYQWIIQHPFHKYETKPVSVLPLLQCLEIAVWFLSNFSPLHFLLEAVALVQAEIRVLGVCVFFGETQAV